MAERYEEQITVDSGGGTTIDGATIPMTLSVREATIGIRDDGTEYPPLYHRYVLTEGDDPPPTASQCVRAIAKALWNK